MRNRGAAFRYAIAILAAAVALFLRYLLTPLLGYNNPYHTVWLAVVFSAWFCGLGPSIATTVLGTLGVWYWFLLPPGSFVIRDRTDGYGLLGFLIFSGAIIALGESNRRGFAARSRLAAIVESSGDAIIGENLDGLITSWNKGAEQIFGYSAEEVIGKPISIAAPHRVNEMAKLLGRVRSGERIDHYETIWKTKHGKLLNVSLTVSPVRDIAGRIVGASKIARDITEQKKAEEALRESEKHLALELADVRRLHELSARLLNGTELVPLLTEVLKTCAELLGTNKGNIQLYDKHEKALKIVAHLGFGEEFLAHFQSIPHGYSVCGAAMEKRERILVEDARTDPRFAELAPIYAKYGFVAVQSTPLIGNDGRFLGMLSNHFSSPHRLTERELRLLDICVQLAVSVIERKRLEQELRDAHDTLERKVEERTCELQQEITERKRTELKLRDSEQSLRQLSVHLIRTQDEERRRIARELHDGVGQLLAVMSVNASRLDREKSNLSSDMARCVEENSKLIAQVTTDIRTMSYLFHPPLLDEMGLHTALKWYVEGFAERSKIAAKLELPADWQRLPEEYELCLFRIAQECLTNIHRHSGSSTALVRLLRAAGEIRLEISDEGKGVNQEIQAKIASGGTAGVGLRGMQERVRQLGGSMEIRSNGKGTTVMATVPFEESARTAASPSFETGQESHSDRPETGLESGSRGKTPSQAAKA
jgi:PAS domain S-box-containing protein